MTPEQQAAYIMAQAACVIAEVAGMQAANQQYLFHGKDQQYGEADFRALIEAYGIHHNSVVSLFQR